jgi:hypothetical protein
MIIVDTLLTVAIAIGLKKCQGGWTRTDALIKRVIVYVNRDFWTRAIPELTISYTVETQMLPTLAAITMSIQYSVDTHTLMAFLYM